MARRDKRRLITFTLGALLLGAAYFLAPEIGGGQDALDRQVGRQPQSPDDPAGGEFVLEALPFEHPEALGQIHDASESERLLLDTDALVPVYEHARRQTPRHFAQLGLAPLDAALRDTLAAAPSNHRLAPLLVRGEVLDTERRRREGGLREDWLVTLQSGEGVIAHALFANPPGGVDGTVAIGDHLRVDGLFYKLYRQEVGNAWLEGPLVLGYRADAAVPPIDAQTARAAPALADVQDDELGTIHELDPTALWQLMARAQTLADETDWAAAPELDEARLRLIFEDGATFRGAPFRIPLSRNMGTYIKSADENPLGLQRTSEGWIANVMWRAPVSMIKWLGPFKRPELAEWDDSSKARYVEARGWFLRNEMYEKYGGEPGRVPVFVLADVTPFVPEDDGIASTIVWVTFSIACFLVTAIFVMLRSDRRKAEQLQEDLVRRRRARREQAHLVATPNP